MSGEQPKARYPRLRNRLKAKVGGSGLGGPGQFSEHIKAHIDAMKVVINERVEGDGGSVGHELTRARNQAIEKYSKV